MRNTFVVSKEGLYFFRVFGWGLWLADKREHRPLFSERNGYRKVLWLNKNWRVMLLRPGK